ncbi:hypothetical protein [Paracoccus jiaweipingae]|uniref:hypothetical protein n=1 Tax=unclassified Paracoccus (in: a-proteobacteria) TaxID=2688777 RepID=UPI0037AEF1B8
MSPDPRFATLQSDRARYFTPRWFAELLSARLSLGDTFWIGNFGTALLIVPVTIILLLLPQMVAIPPRAQTALLGLWLAVLCGFALFLLVAVTRVALRTPSVGGWRWAAVGVTALNTLALLASLSRVLS